VAKCIRGAEASLDFHGILKSAWIPMRAKIPERWGDGVTKEGAGWMQTHPQPFRYQSRYQQALGLAEAFGKHHGILGLGQFHPVLKPLELPEAGDIWTQSVKPRVVLVPGASRRGAIKRWPMHHWLKLASLLKDRCELRWSLGPEEEALREWLPKQTGVPDLPKLSLWRLASALRQADLVIAPDTGLLHLSVVLGVKVLGLYGGSDPVIADIPKGTGEILRTGIECSPCRERKCQRRQCLEELRPEFVASRVSAL
jgi:ADP-heptose:LPS heptosyltransferase